MNNDKLKKILNTRDTFVMAVEYSQRKGSINISIDSMEKYYIEEKDGSYDYLDELPEGKEWTSEGSNSADISVHYFPNLLSLSGMKSMMYGIKSWIVDSIKEPLMFRLHPFSMWQNWVFVVDSWSSVRYDIIDKRSNYTCSDDYQKKVDSISKNEVIKFLDDNEYYEKLDEKFYYSKNDPTCIISLDDHDLKDGYSHKKFAELLNEWIKIAYPTKNEIKFKLLENKN